MNLTLVDLDLKIFGQPRTNARVAPTAQGRPTYRWSAEHIDYVQRSCSPYSRGLNSTRTEVFLMRVRVFRICDCFGLILRRLVHSRCQPPIGASLKFALVVSPASKSSPDAIHGTITLTVSEPGVSNVMNSGLHVEGPYAHPYSGHIC